LLNDCLWYDKLWGPSQRVVTLFIFRKILIQDLSPGDVCLPPNHPEAVRTPDLCDRFKKFEFSRFALFLSFWFSILFEFVSWKLNILVLFDGFCLLKQLLISISILHPCSNYLLLISFQDSH